MCSAVGDACLIWPEAFLYGERDPVTLHLGLWWGGVSAGTQLWDAGSFFPSSPWAEVGRGPETPGGSEEWPAAHSSSRGSGSGLLVGRGGVGKGQVLKTSLVQAGLKGLERWVSLSFLSQVLGLQEYTEIPLPHLLLRHLLQGCVCIGESGHPGHGNYVERTWGNGM